MKYGSLTMTEVGAGIWKVAFGVLVAVAVVAIVFATRTPGASPGPGDQPLAAPAEPVTTSTLPPPRPVVTTDGWRLGLQTPGVAWEFRPSTGEMFRLVEGAADSVPRGGEIVVMRTGGVELDNGSDTTTEALESGDIVLIEPDGDEIEFGEELPWQRSQLPVAQHARFALTPRPVALVPVWFDGETVLRRTALDGSTHDDIPLPGCGEAIPFASTGSDRIFGVWCRDSDDLRLFYDSPGDLVEIRVAEIRGDGLMPALLARGDKPILIDPFGGVWHMLLSESLFDDPDLLIGGSEEAIALRADERILGIAAIATDLENIVVGASSGSDLDGTITAGRLIGHNLLGFGDGWSTQAPVPIVSMVGAPDGMVYALGSADDGGVIMSVDPANGEVAVIASGLPVDHGRLMVLP